MTAYIGPYSPAVYAKSAGAPIYSAPQSRPGQFNVQGSYQNAGSGYTATQPVKPTVLGANTGPSSNQTGGGNPGATTQDPYANLNNQQSSGLDLIEQDYQNALGVYNNQESSLRGQADTANQQIDSESGQVKNQLSNEQTTGIQNVDNGVQTAETGAKTATQQARDLFRQTQQSNIASLSAMGISSSSVAEALAERLGIETARRIAGVTDSLQQVRQNAIREVGRIKDYVAGKLTDLSKQAEIQKANIQNALIQGLNQINSARDQAATDKARSRTELINNTQNAIAQLTQQAQQFDQSLKAWAAQKTAALTPLVTDPNFLNTLASATSNFNQNYAPTGFQYAPQVNTDPYGRVSGQINYNLQKTNQNPYDQQTQPDEYQLWQIQHG